MTPRCPGPIHAITASQGETVRTFSELTKDQLTEAHDSANKMISEKYRSYLPGRLLPLLLRRYRDNLAEALGMPLPELPHRAGQVRAVALDEASPSTYKRAKQFLGTHGVLEANDGPFYVA